MRLANVVKMEISFVFMAAMIITACNAQNVSEHKFVCEAVKNGHCYWTYVQLNTSVNYQAANSICNEHGATPAIIPDEKIYNKILRKARAKIPAGRTWTTIWTGMRFDPETGENSPEDAFWHWYPISSETGEAHVPWSSDHHVMEFTHVYLEVKRMKSSVHQGLINAEPSLSRRGVVCERARVVRRVRKRKHLG